MLHCYNVCVWRVNNALSELLPCMEKNGVYILYNYPGDMIKFLWM